MARKQLTKQQRRLVRELDEVVTRLRLDYRAIQRYKPHERTPRLKLVRDHLVRGEIVLAYTLIDEFLNVILCNHFFGRKSSHIKLWKTKRFKTLTIFPLKS